MGIDYLWDTNTVIYYLQSQFPQNAERFMDGVLKETRPIISAITEIELLCWKTATTNDIKVLKKFIGDAYVIELEQPVKDLTVDIRKRYNLKLPDAIIASSALANDLTLITRNTKDFERINKLKLVNPFDAPNSRN